MSEQITVLKRIAAFAAGVRGHRLGVWHNGEGFAAVGCTRCGQRLTVRYSAMQPDIEGPALTSDCRAVSRIAAA
jgi:hypothetical protein